MAELTQQEIEHRLARKYLNRVIELEIPGSTQMYKIFTKVQRICLDMTKGEPMVLFKSGANVQYTVDLNYFIENAIIHGDPNRGSPGDAGVHKGD